MIQTRPGQPTRPVAPGNDSGEARVSLNDPQSPASFGLLGPFDAGAEAVSVRIAGRPNLLASFQMCAETRTHAQCQRCFVLG
jgi:hypothetical protein